MAAETTWMRHQAESSSTHPKQACHWLASDRAVRSGAGDEYFRALGVPFSRRRPHRDGAAA